MLSENHASPTVRALERVKAGNNLFQLSPKHGGIVFESRQHPGLFPQFIKVFLSSLVIGFSVSRGIQAGVVKAWVLASGWRLWGNHLTILAALL